MKSLAFRPVAAALALVFLSPFYVQARGHYDQSPLTVPHPTSFAQCRQFFVDGRPPVVPQRPALRELCYESFAVLHSGESKTPVYVAERLNRKILEDANEKRADRFFADARLPAAERAELEDYKHSGYSRGHMAPAGDMSTPTAMAQSFSLANMVPQNPQQNGGSWAKIEQDTRKYVLRASGDVYVITGPVFERGAPTIGGGRVRVPKYLFKLVYDASTGKSWAHWQENREGERVSAPISYAELVRRTGMEFLPATAR
ncbi:DNA/RNA non-specific endonuclease (plasmid) [Acidovorax sp. DW039]|uniref:DNA/RNA non-specific endonuclease n=1 Tax=Acidovorax sp. DW039 TaxID=3095606 RepID=UPI003086C99B|nr:DNA/RNA non-specific endonuclease [Acidovorax sp. DW039]